MNFLYKLLYNNQNEAPNRLRKPTPATDNTRRSPHLFFSGKANIVRDTKNKWLIATSLVLREVLQVLENVLFLSIRSWRTKPIVAGKGRNHRSARAILQQRKRLCCWGHSDDSLRPISVAGSWQDDAWGSIEPLPSIVDS